jgi:hypothetical protein
MRFGEQRPDYPTGMFASRAAAIARWLSLRCRHFRLSETKNPTGSSPV